MNRTLLCLAAVLAGGLAASAWGRPEVLLAASASVKAQDKNAAPHVRITVPSNNARFTAPATISVSIRATDRDDNIKRVELLANAALIASLTAPPYDFNWTNVAAGTYVLTARATDALGLTTVSHAVTVSVTAATNQPPTVSIKEPASGAIFNAPATFTVSATAADSDGTVTKVDFFQDAMPIGTAMSPPYSASVANLAAGSYRFTALATDNSGATTTSAAVTITVSASQAKVYYIHTDHLNTPRLITNETAQAVWRWDHAEPFGTFPANENPSGLGAFEFNVRFPGQYFDKETNTHYNYYRDYDPSVGRYVQSDPIGLDGGINTYAYVKDNPLGFIDPNGLDLVVTYYPGAIVDHIGIGVNSPNTYGQYPRDRAIAVPFCRDVPGRISQDRYVQDPLSQSKAQTIVIKTTALQDDLVRQYIENARNAGAQPNSNLTYNLCFDQCTRFVIDALSSGGIGLPRLDSVRPRDLFDVLQQTFGPRK